LPASNSFRNALYTAFEGLPVFSAISLRVKGLPLLFSNSKTCSSTFPNRNTPLESNSTLFFNRIQFIAILHKQKENRTYQDTMGRNGKPLSTYLPRQIENRTMHFDPEFDTFTYGDPTSKRKYLLKLKEGDLVSFLCWFDSIKK